MQVHCVSQTLDMINICIEFMISTFVANIDIVVSQSAGIIQRAVTSIAAHTSAVANNAQVQGVTVFFSTAAKRPQFILQLPVIVTLIPCQIVTSGIDKRRTAVDTEGLGPADSVQNIIKTAQTIIHQTVAYS